MKTYPRWLWLVTIASIIGTIANIQKLPWCFAVWAVTNFTLAIYNSKRREWPQAALFAVYFGLAIWGLAKWI